MHSFTVSLQDGQSGRGQNLLEVGKQLLVTDLLNACLYIVMGHLKKKVDQEDVKIIANPGKCLNDLRSCLVCLDRISTGSIYQLKPAARFAATTTAPR